MSDNLYQSFCLSVSLSVISAGFALVLCLLHDCELLIFSFRELFVSILWGPGWWAFPVWIYVCFGCVPGTTISSLLFLGSSRLCEFVNPHEGWLVITTHQGTSFSFILAFSRPGIVGLIFDFFLHQRFILLPVLWEMSMLFDSPCRLRALSSVLPHFWGNGNQGWNRLGFGKRPQCPIHSGFPSQ